MSNWSRSCVLVPTDFSESSLAALEEAGAIVDDPSHLHVVHVLPSLHPAEPGVTWGTIDDNSRTKEVRHALRERLDGMGLSKAQIHSRIGDAGHSIADVAKEIGADLIVVSSHGRTGLSRLLLGSVAERVARLAPCPVLIVRE